MNGWPTVGVAGARGVVGGVFCSILADAGLPAECLRAFGHEAGNTIAYRGTEVPVRVLDEAAAAELDVLFLAVDAAQSREIMAGPGTSVPLVVDNSSAFRLADGVPLVVPEANAHAARERQRQPDREPELHDRRGGGRAGPDPRPRRPRVGRPGLLPGGERRRPQGPRRLRGGARHGNRDTAAGSPFHGRIAD